MTKVPVERELLDRLLEAVAPSDEDGFGGYSCGAHDTEFYCTDCGAERADGHHEDCEFALAMKVRAALAEPQQAEPVAFVKHTHKQELTPGGHPLRVMDSEVRWLNRNGAADLPDGTELFTHPPADAPAANGEAVRLYHADGSFDELPAEEVKRRRIEAAKVLQELGAHSPSWWADNPLLFRDLQSRAKAVFSNHAQGEGS